MRAVAFFFLLLLTGSALAESEARQGADWVRVSALPCTDEKVVAHIQAAGGDPSDFRAARAQFAGAPYAACWRPIFDKQVIHVFYEDADQGVVPFGHLKPVKAA